MRSAILLAAVLLLSGCVMLGRPGNDARGQDLQKTAAPVAEALRQYQHNNGRLPPSLDALVPRYIAALPTAPRLGYEPAHALLSFGYEPAWPYAGLVNCSTGLNETHWTCVGYL